MNEQPSRGDKSALGRLVPNGDSMSIGLELPSDGDWSATIASSSH
ncbi:hypothetical protein SAMN04487819_1046 [Actinopolyspora alba]|uniref:Uncharacterized protein n=1 Tax=Actinopolyspora alba TaxID=673379 RepID=A0A1I1VMR1_9ACTN|nr:hypothetical protein [Actinopolyspora alba]SFD84094.1 hypothetical protein SAMN04487819_1046 [Actinopolyspora alba]